MMILGFFMLFFSIMFIAVFPESERSAFPYPLGVPGIVIIATGLILYALTRISGTEKEDHSPPS